MKTTEKKEKRPAHAVILSNLEAAMHTFKVLSESPQGKEVNIALTLTCMRLLLNILKDMVIPEKEVDAIIGTLERLKDLAGAAVFALVPEMIDDCRNDLAANRPPTK